MHRWRALNVAIGQLQDWFKITAVQGGPTEPSMAIYTGGTIVIAQLDAHQ